MLKRFLIVLLLSLPVIFVSPVYAGVALGSTRVIYEASQREATISVINSGKEDVYLIQSWVDMFTPTTEASDRKAPFLVTPPLFRLDGEQENRLRIILTNDALPRDRESVFWLNVKAIPAVEKNNANRLLISVKNRIKLFYRPAGAGLTEERAGHAYQQLTFSRQGGQLVVQNPTPFYISFYDIMIDGQSVPETGMVSPFSSKQWPLPAGSGNTVIWRVINDFGGTTEPQSQTLSS
ncbi:putative periplasmic chaperone protein with PapD-like and periplasmic chaperone C-domains [Xenorhabdus nematophila F1]|uniref:fimbrial biogenesis chaperone n=1 Tax=Xenorhabdus nematophila TaxID=628 RepID=UPI0003275A8C|nr:molecular chaperone [Xenorhabdus nematophila]CCW31015.1 putative periplasmic chaperone protein with PapD-like and periplasmic chaperone C-domains [Xenorhabdus nematophila F1]